MVRVHQVLVQPEDYEGSLKNRKGAQRRIRDSVLDLGAEIASIPAPSSSASLSGAWDSAGQRHGSSLLSLKGSVLVLAASSSR